MERFTSSVLFMQNGMTPLHLAVWHTIRSDDYATVKTLLEYNADCSAEDNVIFVAFIWFLPFLL